LFTILSMLVIMTATFVLLIEGEIDTNHLFKVSSFEDAYKQVKEYIKELDVPATLISISLSVNHLK
jgi:prephenate dehydratase